MMIDLLNSEGMQEYPQGSGKERESRIIHAEVFFLFDGVEVGRTEKCVPKCVFIHNLFRLICNIWPFKGVE